MSHPPARQQLALWPTPMGVYQWPQAPDANALLARVFGALRATQSLQRPGEASPHFFASSDDLHQRIALPEWQALVGFIVEGLRDTVMASNGGWLDEQGLARAGPAGSTSKALCCKVTAEAPRLDVCRVHVLIRHQAGLSHGPPVTRMKRH